MIFNSAYEDHKKHLAEQEKALTEMARQWNDAHAGTKGLSGKARFEALRAYHKRVSTETRVIEKEPRLWALKVLSRDADGEAIPALAVKMAKEALGVTE